MGLDSPGGGAATLPPLTEAQRDALDRAYVRVISKPLDGVVFIPGLGLGGNQDDSSTGTLLGCTCVVLEGASWWLEFLAETAFPYSLLRSYTGLPAVLQIAWGSRRSF
jgi:hypothetical protein